MTDQAPGQMVGEALALRLSLSTIELFPGWRVRLSSYFYFFSFSLTHESTALTRRGSKSGPRWRSLCGHQWRTGCNGSFVRLGEEDRDRSVKMTRDRASR